MKLKKVFGLTCFIAFVTDSDSICCFNLITKTKGRVFVTSQIIYLAHIILHLFSKHPLLMQKTSILSQSELCKSQVTITTKYIFSIRNYALMLVFLFFLESRNQLGWKGLLWPSSQIVILTLQSPLCLYKCYLDMSLTYFHSTISLGRLFQKAG